VIKKSQAARRKSPVFFPCACGKVFVQKEKENWERKMRIDERS
jgi:hypothetical protein